MASIERSLGIDSREVVVVAAGRVSSDGHYTFFRLNWVVGRKCSSISYRSVIYPLVARWQDGELNLAGEVDEGEMKRLDEDPSNGHLHLVGMISNDRIFLHPDLIANGGEEQAEAFCKRLVENLSE